VALVLDKINRLVDETYHLKDINLSFEPGSFNVLLGRTLSGKTSLLRIIAGLDRCTNGAILLNGHDVTKLAVQKRKLSMVYQQFINYPHLTVFENIASPLRLARVSAAEITRRVTQTAEMLHIAEYLKRLPLELSGGQQQRCAMARALVKEAELILFDEPLVNLDYKLREELRSELKNLFKDRDIIAIYATTEAQEALAFGGTTTLLHHGQVLQTGPALQQYLKPVNLTAADLYNEPPLNHLTAKVKDACLLLDQSYSLATIAHLNTLMEGTYQFAIRPDHVSLEPTGTLEIALDATVDIAEISASETYLHITVQTEAHKQMNWVVRLNGIYNMHTQTPIRIYLPLAEFFVFDTSGQALHWPSIESGNDREAD
jgi:glycerol transport system ATP-binding protein